MTTEGNIVSAVYIGPCIIVIVQQEETNLI
jgi:hypothetical protein